MDWAHYSELFLQQDDPFSRGGKGRRCLSRKLVVKLKMTKTGIGIMICIRNFVKRWC